MEKRSAFEMLALTVLLVVVSGDVVQVSGGRRGTSSSSTSSPTRSPIITARPRLPTRLGTEAPDTGVVELRNGEGHSWAQWSPWSSCGTDCPPGKTQARTRECLDPQGSTVSDLQQCYTNQRVANVDIRVCRCSNSSSSSSRQAALTASPSDHGVRYCDSCSPSAEVCLAFSDDLFPTCRAAVDSADPTGCAGLCAIETQVCRRLDDDAFRCQNSLEAGSSVAPGFAVPDNHDQEVPVQASLVRSSKHQILLRKNACEDEAASSSSGLLPCDDGATCLDADLFCDGRVDCPDASDEPEGCV